MQRPSEISVGATAYAVVYSRKESMVESAKAARSLFGHTNHSTLTITIDDEVAEPVIRDTLLHEAMHCIWQDAGIRDLELTEEDLVGCLTPRLIALLQDNSELVEYLTNTNGANHE